MENMRAAPSYGMMTQSVCALSFHVLIRLTVHTSIYINCILNRATTTFLFFSYNHHFYRHEKQTCLHCSAQPLHRWHHHHDHSCSRLPDLCCEEQKVQRVNLISCSSLTVRLFWAHFTKMSFNFLYIIIILCCQSVFTSLFSPQ